MKIIPINDTVLLQPIETSDATDIYAAIDNQRNYLREFLPFVDKTEKPEDTVAFVCEAVNIAREKKQHTFTIRVEGRFAGLIGYKDLDRVNRKVEIGYWLCEQFQHQGIMTNAVKALCRMAFNELQLNRVQIKCATGNIKSKRIPLRLGFMFEGCERQGELMYNGNYADIEIYSLLKPEFTE